jgi:hypothetical protein
MKCGEPSTDEPQLAETEAASRSHGGSQMSVGSHDGEAGIANDRELGKRSPHFMRATLNAIKLSRTSFAIKGLCYDADCNVLLVEVSDARAFLVPSFRLLASFFTLTHSQIRRA